MNPSYTLDKDIIGKLSSIKYLFFDIEGTLTPDKDIEIPKEKRAIIKQLTESKRSIKFGILTGRDLSFAMQFSDIIREGIILCESGAIIYNIEDKNKINIIDRAKLSIIKMIEKDLDSFVNSIGGSKEYKDTMLTYDPPKGVSASELEREIVSFLSELSSAKGADLLKGISITHSQSAVDITVEDLNKGIGLRRWAELYSVNLEDVGFIGDGANDIEACKLLCRANGLFLAPKNLSIELKSAIESLQKEHKNAFIIPYESTDAVIAVLYNLP